MHNETQAPTRHGRRADSWSESGPTDADLAAIEAEWPVMAVELAVVDAEIAALSTVGGPSPLHWRRIRRAEHQVLAARLRRLRSRRAEGVPGAA